MVYRAFLMFVLTCVTLGMSVGAGADEATSPAALIVIDIQGFYFEGGALPLVGSVSAAETAAAIVEGFRALGWPVIHIQHLPKTAAGPGQDIEPETYRIHDAVAPLPGETVIGKRHANSFRDTSLADVLEKLGVKRLVIIGMQTHMCLEAATRAAADLGYEVTVVDDACATRDLEFGGVTVPAAHVHAATLAAVNGTYARVVDSETLLSEMKALEPTTSQQ